MSSIPTVDPSLEREGERQEYYSRGGSAEGTADREGTRRRRLTATTATKLGANQQHQFAREPEGQRQQEATGEESTTTTTAGAGAAESRPAAAAPDGRSDNTISRTASGVQGSAAWLEGAVGLEARVQGVQMEGEDQVVESDGAVEAEGGGEAEGDKGIEEGEAEGFVVVARDDKVRGGRAGISSCIFCLLLLPMRSSGVTRGLARGTTVACLGVTKSPDLLVGREPRASIADISVQVSTEVQHT